MASTAVLQRSFDDLGTPLHQVTFCIVDVETTGASPQHCAITEVGAVKLRGGECLGTFQTLVNPGLPIPPSITVLTGITQAMVLPAPSIGAVLPALAEFARGTVLVGHNVRFDLAFLNSALRAADRPPLANLVVDTCGLARRLVRDEVANCRLGTLAEHFRLDHRPTHRALADALATGDLLHLLLERAAAFGVLGLDDLVALPTMAGHPQVAKLRLTTHLPRRPGVYVFRDRGGRPLYVGKASDLRSRVRSYFSSDDRRKTGQLLREATTIDHVECRSPLEAAVLEVRLIGQLAPRFNRHLTHSRRYVYLKVTDEPFPRLAVARVVRPDRGFYLGPIASTRVARRIADAIETVLPVRRCTAPARPGRLLRNAPCAPAQLGVAACPCAGTHSETEYDAIVEQVRRGLTCEPGVLLGPLRARIDGLAAVERFEEAADVRDRADALVGALRRQRRLDGLVQAGRLVLELDDGGRIELDSGRLVAVSARQGDDGEPALPFPTERTAAARPPPTPVPRELADEIACVAGWLDRYASRVRVVHCDGGLASPLPELPSFAPREPRHGR